MHPEVTLTGSCKQDSGKNLLYVTLEDKSEMQFEIADKKLTLQSTGSMSDKVSSVYKRAWYSKKQNQSLDTERFGSRAARFRGAFSIGTNC